MTEEELELVTRLIDHGGLCLSDELTPRLAFVWALQAGFCGWLSRSHASNLM